MSRALISLLFLLPLNVLAGQGAGGFLRKMVKEAANAQIPAGAVEIKLVSLRASPLVDSGDKPVAVHFRRGEDFSGSTLVELEIGGRSKWVQAEFQLLVNTAVARVNLPRGHVLSAEDMRLKAVAKSKLHGDKPIAPRDVLGLIVVQQLKAGQALVMRSLKRPVVIHRGDEVQILVSSGSVRVSSPGKALAAGRTGDVISVSRASDRSRAYRLRAKVLASGLVLLELGNQGLDRP